MRHTSAAAESIATYRSTYNDLTTQRRLGLYRNNCDVRTVGDDIAVVRKYDSQRYIRHNIRMC